MLAAIFYLLYRPLLARVLLLSGVPLAIQALLVTLDTITE
jgi:hypothetical protein